MNSRKILRRARVKKIFLELIIIIIKFLLFLSGGLGALFFFLISPLRAIIRFVFYKVIVKIYCYYLSFLKKLGWNRRKGGALFFLFNEKMVHVAVGIMVLLTILINMAPLTNAQPGPTQQREAIIYNLVQGEFGELEEREELIEKTLDKEDFLAHVSDQSRYREDLPAIGGHFFSGQDRIERTSLSTSSAEEEIEGVADEEFSDDRREIVEYTVQPGDTITSIADKFDISVNTILWENDLSAYDLIRSGDELDILPVSGVTHKVNRGESLSQIVGEYDVDREEVIDINNIDDPERLSVGQKLIIPGGEKDEPSSSSTQSTSQSQSRSSGQSALSAVRDAVSADKREESPRSSSDGKMQWPTPGHRITQYYSWRHHGLDIADSVGTSLYAAESGVVEFVGWSRGYGNNIVIDHGGGKKTRYAHMNSFYVNSGEGVSKGQTIGEMGNTGWSTGPHLHFEVIINSSKQNPLNYIK